MASEKEELEIERGEEMDLVCFIITYICLYVSLIVSLFSLASPLIILVWDNHYQNEPYVNKFLNESSRFTVSLALSS